MAHRPAFTQLDPEILIGNILKQRIFIKMAILETIHLTKRFENGFTALQDVNFSLNNGDFVILAGANGSGKTVLARHLNGLLLPSQGEVLLEGIPITRNLTETRKQVGLVFQDSDSQIVGETVASDVAFGPENLGLTASEVTFRVKEALAMVGLTEMADQRPHRLSGGQKRKLVIAGVLAMRPRIIVLDEPFTGLDYPGVVQVLTQLLRLHREGYTLMVITHELEKVLAHATRMVVMDAGRIVLDGKAVDLIERVEEFGIKRPYGARRPVETMTWLS
jgi:biotin transport system ATP-binding protein